MTDETGDGQMPRIAWHQRRPLAAPRWLRIARYERAIEEAANDG